MKNNTIKTLNSKIWYRLLKVIYIFFILVFAIGALVGGYLVSREADSKKTMIICEDGNEYNASKENIHIYDSYISQSDLKDAQKLCQFKGDIKLYLGESNLVVPENNNPHIKFIPKFNMVFATLIGIGYLALVLLGFEILRRIFYYVVLGKIVPPIE